MASIHLKENFSLRDDTDTKEVHYSQVEKSDETIVHYYSYFACTCDDEDKKYWKQRIHDYMPDFDPEVHADIVSQLVMEINHTYNGSVGIDSDMWFGISTTCQIWNDDYSKSEKLNVHMQCDEVSIGLMAIIDILRKVVLDDQD